MRSGGWLLLLCVIALPLFFAGLSQRGFTDNEGMYAEIGREILISGDWVTPHLNGGVYLNKPPLLFWLTAGVLRVGGINELPRLIGGLAALGTLLLVYALGRRLWPTHPTAGVWAAAVYLSSALTPIEARILRPDALLAFLMTLTMWGVVRVYSRPGPADRRGVAAIWVGIGLGVMDKGLLGLLLPALAFCPALLLGCSLREARRCAPWWGLGLAAALILPWHIAAGMANPGFWWDYVVNQHLLYFFDQKFPRDSVSDPLGFAWAAFAGRLAPWVLLLPAAVIGQIRRTRTERSVTAWLPLTWFGMIWLFFSLSRGRLEYYFLPAVPAAALLVGRLCDEWSTPMKPLARPLARPRRPVWRALPFLIVGLAATVALLAAPVLGRSYDLEQTAPNLLRSARDAFAVVALGSLVATLLALVKRNSVALGVWVATFLLFGAVACRSLAGVDSLTSSRPLIATMDPLLLSHSTLAYDAGEEYQLCGGLNFYLRRRLLLLKPPGFIPPTYLRGEVNRLFTERDRFWDEWRRANHRILLFTEPTRPRMGTAGFPVPCYEVARSREWLVVTNQPLPEKLATSSWKMVKRIVRH